MVDSVAYISDCWMRWAWRSLDVIIYLHGFNSSPQSIKARQFGQYLQDHGLGDQWFCPALPPSGDRAIAIVERAIAAYPRGSVTFVGSSLGGFYATWLAEKHDGRAVLINPSITPHLGLRDYLGEQANMYTGERYQLTEAHLQEWEKRFLTAITPARYLLLVETGDELLDYRKAVTRYSGAHQVVVEGGDHSLQSFIRHIPAILEFAGLSPGVPPRI